MELSNYKVEIIGGRHMSQPTNNTTFSGSGSLFSSPLGNSSWGTPWSPWRTPSIWSAPITDNKDRSYVEMRDGDHYTISLYNGHSSRCHAKITIDGKHVGTWILEPWGSAKIERPVDVHKKFTFFKVNSIGGAEAGLVRGDAKNGLVTVEFIPECVERRTNFFESAVDRCLGSNSKGLDLGSYFGEEGFGDDFDHDFLSTGNQQLSSNGFSQGHSRRSLGGRTAQFRTEASGRKSFGLENCVQSAQSFEAGGTGLKGRSDQDFRMSTERMQLDENAKITINLRLVARKDVDFERITPLGARSNGVPPPIF